MLFLYYKINSSIQHIYGHELHDWLLIIIILGAI